MLLVGALAVWAGRTGHGPERGLPGGEPARTPGQDLQGSRQSENSVAISRCGGIKACGPLENVAFSDGYRRRRRHSFRGPTVVTDGSSTFNVTGSLYGGRPAVAQIVAQLVRG